LHITGRIKNLIVLGGGKKIHPEEVENVLARSTLIKEICVLAICAKSGLKEGTEKVCAVVVPSEEITKQYDGNFGEIEKSISRDFSLLAQDLASYKRPSCVIVYNEDLPKTSTRKVQRKKVIDWVEANRNN
jgi:long-chain acyl-CoA synthetase